MTTLSLPLPPPEIKEIRRYAGCPAGADEMLSACLAEIGELTCRVCFAQYPVTPTASGLDLGFAVTDSADLKKALTGCDGILLFAATVGLLSDRLVARYERLSPAKAVWLNAIGAERVEAGCNVFCRRQGELLSAEGKSLRPRFSPGYGDLPLALQRDIFAALDCPRQIGVTLGDSLLMIPSKSVTAIAGISKERNI